MRIRDDLQLNGLICNRKKEEEVYFKIEVHYKDFLIRNVKIHDEIHGVFNLIGEVLLMVWKVDGGSHVVIIKVVQVLLLRILMVFTVVKVR